MKERVNQLGFGLLISTLTLAASHIASFAQNPPSPPPAANLLSQDRSNLLGDMGGLQPALDAHGISLSIQEQSEVLGNLTGGVQHGAEYDGLTTMSLIVDTAKAFGWDGGTFDISALQIHGRDLTTDNLHVLQTVSGIEAERTTRLWELWYQQKFFGGAADVKLGQQSLDQEFMVSQFSALFMNAMMGWPALPSLDLYAGGPAYPLSSLGIRFRAHPTDAVTVLAGVFDDNPPGGPFNNDPQLRGAEAAGVRFNLGTGALFLTELQYAINQPSSDPHAPPPTGLPGVYKVGAWFDTGRFPDQEFDNTGLSLANPLSTGIPQMRHGNFSIYALADQTVWQPDPKSPQALGVFVRAMGAPPNMNLVTLSADTGLNLKAPLPGRDADSFGVGYGIAKISSRAAQLDQDMAFFTGTPYPVRSAEQFVEVTYQFEAAGWWQIQPDFQYFINPGGGIPNPNVPGQRIKDEAVLGVRTTVAF